MGGVVKKIIKVAAVVAAVALAIPTGGTSLLAYGLSISATAAAVLATGLALGSSLLSPRPKAPSTPQSSTDRLTASINPRAPRKIVFGRRTAMATDIVDQEFSADEAYLHRFIVNASHVVTSVDEVWFDDKLAWTKTGGVQGDFLNYLDVIPTPRGDAYANISARMGATRRMYGLANIYFRYRLLGNTNKQQSPFNGSIPSRITIIGDGAPVYDPRWDSTRGGTGPQRVDDQATWAFVTAGNEAGNNPALQLLFYLLGWRINGKLAVGKGVPPERIDFDSFITAANLCDEPVTLIAGGTEPRYRSAGVFSEGDSPTTVLDNLKAAMNAVLDDVDGKIRLSVLHNDLAGPIPSFDDDDILDGFDWQQTQPLDQSFNIVRGSFPDPASLYQMVEYPEVKLDSIDSIDRIESVDFALVQSVSQAQRLAKQRLQRAQYGGIFSAEFQATAWRVQKGDVITLTFSALGWTNKLFRVIETTVRVDGVVPMVLREEHPVIYAWDNDESPAVQPAGPTTYDPLIRPAPTPLAGVWTLTSPELGEILPSLRIQGISEYPGAKDVLIEYRKAAVAEWTTVGIFQASDPVDALIKAVEPLTAFYARIANRSEYSVSDWLVLGPVTTPDAALPLADFDELKENFDNRNDRIATPAVAPVVSTTGSAVDHTVNKNGSIDLSFDWTFPSGEEANHDYFEVMLYSADVAGAYTPGTALGFEERWTVPLSARGSFRRGLPADRWYTWAVRSARVVDADIDVDQIIHSVWVKSTRSEENPYYPPTIDPSSGDITTTIDGTPAAEVTEGLNNFNSRNDRNPITPLAPTLPGGGAAIDHTPNDDGSVDISFEWNWTGIEADNDGFEVEVFTSPTSFAYTPGSSQNALVTRMPIQRRGFIIQGVAANSFYTFAVRTWRGVDPDINATGLLYSAWVKSTVSGENPYQPNANPASTIDILGTIAGRAATVVAATVGPDGVITSGKVNENSIIDGAVNLANYTLAASSFYYTTPGLKAHHFTAATETTTAFGQSILARAGVMYEMRAVDPTQGAAYTVIFNLRLLEWNGTDWINSLVSTDFPVSEVWNEATTTGVMPFGQRVITPEIRFTGLNPSKMFAIGLELIVPTGCNVRIEKIYSRMDLMKKTQ